MKKQKRFQDRVIKIVSVIPLGKTLTYKEVAKLAGSPRAYRAVGNILNNNYHQGKVKIPCHRVIRSDGKLGGYAGGYELKAQLLKSEKIS